ncbi:MAG: hypothetical protein ACPL4I_13065, partial [Bacteroidota bacterium]
NRFSYVRNNPLRFTDPSGHALHAGVADEYQGASLEEIRDQYWDLADAALGRWKQGDRFSGFYHEHLSAKAAYYRDLANSSPPEVIEADQGMVEQTYNRLLVNGLHGPDVALDTAYRAGGGPTFLIEAGPALMGLPVLTGAVAAGPTWPQSPEEMDQFLGMEGRRIPDTSTTPGHGKVVWQTSDKIRITYEQHPYHPDAPEWHRGPHYHLDIPSGSHYRFLPGEEIPGYK